MPVTSIDELFGGPWGIVEKRRKEIEDGAFGAFDRIYKEEVAKNFLPISKVAETLDCHDSTARKGLRDSGARYIVDGQGHFYYCPDVDALKAKRTAAKRAAESRRATPAGAAHD